MKTNSKKQGTVLHTSFVYLYDSYSHYFKIIFYLFGHSCTVRFKLSQLAAASFFSFVCWTFRTDASLIDNVNMGFMGQKTLCFDDMFDICDEPARSGPNMTLFDAYASETREHMRRRM